MAVLAMRSKAAQKRLDIIELTPELAVKMLENNRLNRPLSQPHVNRIANQIREGKWKFNGDTIKLSDDGEILDGQHRCWGVVEANRAIETVIVYGVAREAFSTVDTLRKPRSGADILALNGATGNRTQTAAALTWLLRWQRGVLGKTRGPEYRVENGDIEEAHKHHPAMGDAVDAANAAVRGFASPSLFGFFYYVLSSRDRELADRMLQTLGDPAGISVTDPFFRLRTYLLSETWQRRDAVLTFALAIKAANAAKSGKKVEKLIWRNQGDKPEPFPTLDF